MYLTKMCRSRLVRDAWLWSRKSPKGREIKIRPRGYKTFFILNSVEHEILNAQKYENIKKFSIFSDSDKLRMLFFLLITVKMPTIVGILIFMSRKNFMLN